jgi:hypothetical protein
MTVSRDPCGVEKTISALKGTVGFRRNLVKQSKPILRHSLNWICPVQEDNDLPILRIRQIFTRVTGLVI